MIELTSEENMLLARLRVAPQPDRDCIPERVLVNSGLARRSDTAIGMIHITQAGHGYQQSTTEPK